MSDSETDTAFLIQNLVKKYSPREEEEEEEVPLEQCEETPSKKIRKRPESEKVKSHLLKARPIAIQKRKEYAQARREAKEQAEKNKYVSDLKKIAIEEMGKIKELKEKKRQEEEVERMREEMKKKEVEEEEDDNEQTEEEEEELPVPKKKKKRIKTPIPKKIKRAKKVQVKVKEEGKKKRVIRASDLETSSEDEEEEDEEIIIMKSARSVIDRKRDIKKQAPKAPKKKLVKREEDWFNSDGYYF
jgi:hypothetical protein